MWMDGSTLRLAFKISNTGKALLYHNMNSPASLFRRLRVLAGGVEVADLASYGCSSDALKPPSRTAPSRGRDRRMGLGVWSARWYKRDSTLNPKRSLLRIPDIGQRQEARADAGALPFSP